MLLYSLDLMLGNVIHNKNTYAQKHGHSQLESVQVLCNQVFPNFGPPTSPVSSRSSKAFNPHPS